MSKTQAIILSKEFFTEMEAEKWIMFHRYHPIKPVHETKQYYRFRLENPRDFSHFITKEIEDGVKLIIGFY
jgi:hypothetical protein